MEIKHIIKNRNMAVAIEGELNAVTAHELGEFIDSNIDQVDNLVFDMEKLEYISSAGLRVLLKAQLDLRKRNGRFALKKVPEDIVKVFELSGFDRTMDIEAL